MGASLCFFWDWTQTLEAQTNMDTESPEHAIKLFSN